MVTERWIRELIANGEEWRFYKTREWLNLRAQIMEKHHNECQECLKRGKVTAAKIVHHINELKDRPDLALREFYVDAKGIKRENLVAICQDCHNIAHGRICANEHKPQLNKERW